MSSRFAPMDDDPVVAGRAVPDAVTELLALVESLSELDVDGVEPVLGAPRWA